MLQFKRLPSDILPTAHDNNVVLVETSNGVFYCVDSDGVKQMATTTDVKSAVEEAVSAVQSDIAHKADMTVVRTLVEQYNAAIQVINNLSERLAALESNYDPTVIK